MVEEVCPLCGEDVKFFDINFNEAVLMCSNKTCPYPFEGGEMKYAQTSSSAITLDFMNKVNVELEDEDVAKETQSHDFFDNIDTFVSQPKKKKLEPEDKISPKKPSSSKDDYVKLEEINNLSKIVTMKSPQSYTAPVKNPQFLRNLQILADKKRGETVPLGIYDTDLTEKKFDIKVVHSDQSFPSISIDLT